MHLREALSPHMLLRFLEKIYSSTVGIRTILIPTATEIDVMVTLPTYHICLICTAIESPPQGGLPPQVRRPPVTGSPSESREMAVVRSTYGSREKASTTCLYSTKFAMLIEESEPRELASFT